jgi:hypothetical protein
VLLPWATPAHAVAWLRSYRASLTNPDRIPIVHLGNGTYWDTALSLTDADSLTAFQATGPGNARLVGGYQLNGATCSVYSGSIYKCPLRAGAPVPHTIIENHVRATIARTPNVGSDTHYPAQQAPWILTQSTGSNSHTVLGYSSSDVNLSGVAATDVQVVTQSGGTTEWFWEIIPVASINTSTHQITTSQNARYYFYPSAASRYYLQGALDFLDAQGEAYIDGNDVHGTCGTGQHCLYYWPRGNIATAELIIPDTLDAVRVVGTDESHLAHDISFTNIWFEGSDSVSWWRYGTWGADYPTPPCTLTGPDWDPSAGAGHTYCTFSVTATIAANQHGMVFVQNTGGNITFEADRFSNSGLAAVYGFGHVQGLTVDESLLEKCGYSCFALETNKYPSEGNVNFGNALTNSIEDLPGQIIGHGRCWDLMGSATNTIAYNNCGRGAREGSFDTGSCASANTADCYDVGNLIHDNWIHDMMEDSSDGGALYTSSLILSTSSQYSTNYYHNISIDRTLKNPSILGIPPAAFYFDTGASAFDAANSYALNVAAGDSTLINRGSGDTAWNFLSSVAGIPWATIGADVTTHPYASVVDYTFSDDFESGLGNWTTGIGSPTNTCAVTAHSGTHCFCTTVDGTAIYFLTPGAMRKKLSYWFYDDSTQTLTEFLVRADASLADYSSATSEWKAFGVDTSTHSSTYVTVSSNVTRDTGIARTTGWHHVVQDLRFRDHMELSVDGVLVDRSAPQAQPLPQSFNVVVAGDITVDGRVGTACIDDVTVTD